LEADRLTAAGKARLVNVRCATDVQEPEIGELPDLSRITGFAPGERLELSTYGLTAQAG